MTDRFSTAVSLWCPAIPMTEEGMPLRPNAGPEERSLVRILATMLMRSGRRANPLIPTTKLANGGVAWVLAGRPWTLAESMESPNVTGDARIGFGMADFRDGIKLNYQIVDRSARKQLWQSDLTSDYEDIDHVLIPLARAIDSIITPSRPALRHDAWASWLPTQKRGALWPLMAAIDIQESMSLRIQIANPDAAFASIAAAVDADPNCSLCASVAIGVSIRWVAEKHGDPAFAFKALEHTKERMPQIPRMDLAIAECHFALEKYDVSLGLTTKYLKIAKGGDAAHAEEMLGRIYEKLNEPAKAASAWRRAVQLDPSRGQSWQFLGYMAAQLNKWEEAELCYARAAEVAPRDAALQEKLKAVRAEVIKIREKRGPLTPAEPDEE